MWNWENFTDWFVCSSSVKADTTMADQRWFLWPGLGWCGVAAPIVPWSHDGPLYSIHYTIQYTVYTPLPLPAITREHSVTTPQYLLYTVGISMTVCPEDEVHCHHLESCSLTQWQPSNRRVLLIKWRAREWRPRSKTTTDDTHFQNLCIHISSYHRKNPQDRIHLPLAK